MTSNETRLREILALHKQLGKIHALTLPEAQMIYKYGVRAGQIQNIGAFNKMLAAAKISQARQATKDRRAGKPRPKPPNGPRRH